MTSFETILVTHTDRVATITLNRPKALNALNTQVMNEVTGAAAELDADPGVGAIILMVLLLRKGLAGYLEKLLEK